MGGFFSDLLHLHPIGAIQDLPGGQFTTHLGYKFATDLIKSVENAPTGIYQLGTTAIHHPGELPAIGESLAKEMYGDFSHPLRHPGNTFLDALAVLPVLGLPARAAEIGGIISRGGEMSAGLKAAQEAGATIPAGTMNRLVNPVTGATRSTGYQVANAILRGSPREPRPIYPMTDKSLLEAGDEGMDSPHGLVHSSPQYGLTYSKDPIIRAAQRQVNKLYEANPTLAGYPIWRVLPPFWRSQSGRIRSAARAEQLAIKKEKASGVASFAKEYSGLTTPDQLTGRIALEGTLPSDLIKMHEDALANHYADLTAKQRQETRLRLQVLPQVAERFDTAIYKDDVTGKEHPYAVLKPEYAAEHPEIQKFIDEGRKISHERDYASIAAGALHEVGAHGRITAPYEFARTGKLPISIKEINQQLGQLRRNPFKNQKIIDKLEARLKEAHGQQSLLDPTGEGVGTGLFTTPAERQRFAQYANLARVPYAFDRQNFFDVGARNIFRRAYKGGRPTIPGTYTHPFTAAILKTGGGNENIARLIAESYTEAHRFLGLKAIRDNLVRSVVATPENIPKDQRQLVRTDERIPNVMGQRQAERAALGEGLPSQVGDKLMEDRRLSPIEMIMGGRIYEGLRKRWFPNHEVGSPEELGFDSTKPEEMKQYNRLLGQSGDGKFHAVPGYGWINKAQLGDLHKTNPLIGLYERPIVTRAIRSLDALNSAVKSSMLFLRPAYLLPNLFGNVFLNLIQQGPFFPYHMAHNWLTWHGLGKEDRAALDSQMGSGYSTAAAYEKGTRLGDLPQRGAAAASRVYGKFMDDPFRRNAFLHEAAVQGFVNPEEVSALLNDPKFVDQLRQITTAANDEIISYDRLGPGEEQILRRLVLFYPFTKGSARYALNLTKEHPFAAGMVSALGQRGTAYQESRFGPGELPPYMAGIIPVGPMRNGIIRTINPTSTSPIAEPAMLLHQILNLGSATPNKYLALSQNLAPVDLAALDAITGGKTATITPRPGTSIGGIATGEAFGGIPLLGLLNQLHGQSAVGGPPGLSVYPGISKRDAILRYMAFGGLKSRPTNIPLAQFREQTAGG